MEPRKLSLYPSGAKITGRHRYSKFMQCQGLRPMGHVRLVSTYTNYTPNVAPASRVLFCGSCEDPSTALSRGHCKVTCFSVLGTDAQWCSLPLISTPILLIPHHCLFNHPAAAGHVGVFPALSNHEVSS